MWTEVLKYGVPLILDAFINSGNSKTTRQATSTQLDISKAILQMLQGNYKEDLPFKRDTYSAIRNQFGRLPTIYRNTQYQQNNPFERMRKGTIDANGRLNAGDLTKLVTNGTTVRLQ
jgi:hypothetical protein